MPAKHRRKLVHFTPHHQSSIFIYLFFLLLLILASVTMVQQSQEMRQFAQDATPTPTPMLRCGVPCTYNSQCPTGLFCSNGLCRNPSCSAAEDCTCIITPTPNPYPSATPVIVYPTSTPRPTGTPTLVPTLSPTPTIDISPTASPTPAFEVTPESPKKISLLQAVIQFIGTLFCKIFRTC